MDDVKPCADLIDFVEKRIEEEDDRATRNRASATEETDFGLDPVNKRSWLGLNPEVLADDADRTLAALRAAIVASQAGDCDRLRQLAKAEFGRHPDYREEWRP